ncbi:MAG: DEAD/DEAH box helicase [Epsilonproteobacteria bacterium]|nr:DEAD/DEAH box helicase [Campylobacterota bacterium]
MQARFYEFLKKNDPKFIITADEEEAKTLHSYAKLLSKPSYYLKEIEIKEEDEVKVFKEELDHLYAVLNYYYHSNALLIIPYKTYLTKLPSREYFKRVTLEFAQTLNLKELEEILLQFDYTKVDIVESKGEFCIRGDVIDVFSPNFLKPIRITLTLEDEIESIRFYDPFTQISIKDELDSVTIFNAGLGVNFLEAKKEKLEGEIYATREFNSNWHLIPPARAYKEIEVKDLNKLIEVKKGKKKLFLVVKDQKTLRRSFIKELTAITPLYGDAIISIENEEELIVSLERKRKEEIKKVSSSLVLGELDIGDYVVHHRYGIGIFKGIKNQEFDGIKKDVIEIEYHGGDRLLLPVENLDLVDRYIGSEKVTLDKLGSKTFAKKREKIEKELNDIANELVETSAQREILKAPSMVIPPEIKLFWEGAGFEYTLDQKRAIEKLLTLLKGEKAMDLLLSGDVGFGKTEVAMSGFFMAAKNGFQSAMVVPTTLLSSQHYENLKRRLEPWGVKVAKLDRFVKGKEKKEIIEGVKSGSIDLIVGTHALLDLEFKNLGLAVVDEEHKFGVKQKEKLKEFSKNVHLLSMSATPIPRTLYMSLSKIKQIAELKTPPTGKKAVRTYIKKFTPNLVKEVVLRELRRGGQVFYIHNRIESIEEKKKELEKLLPTKKILVLHSKVKPTLLEEEMLKFAKGEYDILLSTSIVESGIHLPNVNTIIVERADRFGISDLHQLRGRVGRGKKEGFCYFLTQEELTPNAKMRLEALQKNSYLGSGLAVALIDMNIRGWGNLVGKKQSGHMEQIGYHLYLKMLEEKISKLALSKGELKVELQLKTEASLSGELIPNDRLKLELYRRLANINSFEELDSIEDEIKDRFGKIDSLSKRYLDLIEVKLLAQQQEIVKVMEFNKRVTFEFLDGRKEYLKVEEDSLKEVKEHLLVTYNQRFN